MRELSAPAPRPPSWPARAAVRLPAFRAVPGAAPFPQDEAAWAEVHLPHVPTVDELRERARERFAHTPSLDEIAERSRQLTLQSVSVRVFGDGDALPA